MRDYVKEFEDNPFEFLESLQVVSLSNRYRGCEAILEYVSGSELKRVAVTSDRSIVTICWEDDQMVVNETNCNVDSKIFSDWFQYKHEQISKKVVDDYERMEESRRIHEKELDLSIKNLEHRLNCSIPEIFDSELGEGSWEEIKMLIKENL